MTDKGFNLLDNSKPHMSGVTMFDLISKIAHRALICTSNMDEGGNEKIVNGLVCGHAYSLLGVAEVELKNKKKQKLVRIRNPWAKTEWTGAWGDGKKGKESKQRVLQCMVKIKLSKHLTLVFSDFEFRFQKLGNKQKLSTILQFIQFY